MQAKVHFPSDKLTQMDNLLSDSRSSEDAPERKILSTCQHENLLCCHVWLCCRPVEEAHATVRL